ncbi:hypothetical protein BpHYR1_051026 [Brachionus plicatilis]|uniref:Uncharacterized protein n=1 Tax=Brachionus plicatilis TaxID=10195 RepID=A0A3M7SR92_BRAPC|nr:hypothetical protein BpHYR1_051026 [Brachionus plicatilis]
MLFVVVVECCGMWTPNQLDCIPRYIGAYMNQINALCAKLSRGHSARRLKRSFDFFTKHLSTI